MFLYIQIYIYIYIYMYIYIRTCKTHMTARERGHVDTHAWTLGKGDLDTWTPGHVDTFARGHLDTWTIGNLETSTLARTPEIHKKSSKINALENGAEHLGRLVKA